MTTSCLKYPSMELRREHTYHDMQYSHGQFYTNNISRASTVRSHYSDTCGNGNYYESISPEGMVVKSRTDTYREVFPAARGDPAYPTINSLTDRVHSSRQPTREHVVESQNSSSSVSTPTKSMKKIQTKLTMLEDQNVVLQTRTQNLIAENKVLKNQLEREVAKTESFEQKLAQLQEEFNQEKQKLVEISAKEKKLQGSSFREEQTLTDSVPTFDRGVQEWAVCKGCQRKLESCEKEPPTVSITKAELETLERDMQVLRDTVISREKEWDQAMEREQTYRQQLVRLTAETITEHHISNSRFEEMQNLSENLMEKESEIKTMQTEMSYLNKLIVKLDKFRKDTRESAGDGFNTEITEKDQKYIEEIVRRVSNFKNKMKLKSKSTNSDKNSKVANQQNEHKSPRSIGKNQ